MLVRYYRWGAVSTSSRVHAAISLMAVFAVSLATVGLAQAPRAAGPHPPHAPGASPPAAAPTAVMQIRKDTAGDISYRFISSGDVTQPLTALVTPPGTNNVAPIPIPAGFTGAAFSSKDARLEVVDPAHRNVGRVPVTTSGVTVISERTFTLAQRADIPVQVHGLGVIGATVTLAGADKRYNKTWTLAANDNGIARFDDVPLNVSLTATVQFAGHTSVSSTRTLQPSRASDEWPPIAVDWADAKTAPPPPNPNLGPATLGTPQARPDTGAGSSEPRQESGGGIWSTLVSLAILAAIGYGLFWAYQNGKLTGVLAKLGLNQPQASVGGPQPSPFDAPARAPLQPITEGTADPIAGIGMAAAAPVSNGPRLVATVGSYAGTIFPIMGASADIGRDPSNAISLPNDTNASRRHAVIQGGAGVFSVVDAGSSNGTYVNGVRIPAQSPQPLRPGDELNIGNTRFRFEA